MKRQRYIEAAPNNIFRRLNRLVLRCGSTQAPIDERCKLEVDSLRDPKPMTSTMERSDVISLLGVGDQTGLGVHHRLQLTTSASW